MSQVAEPVTVELTQGHVALISKGDASIVLARKWHAVKCGGGKLYARSGGVYLHRALMASHLDAGLVVDHINGDGLDNRRENLRVVNPSANTRNIRKFRGISGLRGVYPQKGKFLARVGKSYLGFFETPVEAAFAVNQELNRLDGNIGVRNHVDYDELIAILLDRRSAIDDQLEKIIEASK